MCVRIKSDLSSKIPHSSGTLSPSLDNRQRGEACDGDPRLVRQLCHRDAHEFMSLYSASKTNSRTLTVKIILPSQLIFVSLCVCQSSDGHKKGASFNAVAFVEKVKSYCKRGPYYILCKV